MTPLEARLAQLAERLEKAVQELNDTVRYLQNPEGDEEDGTAEE